MSIIKFQPFDSKTSKAITGNRLSKVTFRAPRNGEGEKRQSVCVELPVVTDFTAEQLQQLQALTLAAFIEAQDSIVRERYEAGADFVGTDHISVEAIAAWHATNQESGSSGRLTTEYLIEWFMTDMHDSLLLALADKLGIPNEPNEQQQKQLTQLLGNYRDAVTALASPRTQWDSAKIQQVSRALAFATDGDTRDKLQARLAVMEKKAAESQLIL